MILEVQRIRRRMRARPWPVIVSAALITAGLTYKIATMPQHVQSEVVLALTEGSMARDTALPVDELRSASGAALASTTREVQPVHHIEDIELDVNDAVVREAMERTREAIAASL